MRTLRIAAVSILLLAAACSSSSSANAPSPSPHRSRTHVPKTATPSFGTPTPTVAPTAHPSGIPSGTPQSYAKDVPATKLQPQALVPPGVTVTDAWSTTTSAGDTAGLAFVRPGDPLRAAHGLVIWRRTPGAVPPWRPVLGISTAASAGVLQIETLLGEATGDGSDDALVFESTGGSGACGTTLVVDLAANAIVFTKTACDTVVGFSPKPVGLDIRQAIFGPTDSHCCPSSFRTTVLTYTGQDWVVASRTTTPT